MEPFEISVCHFDKTGIGRQEYLRWTKKTHMVVPGLEMPSLRYDGVVGEGGLDSVLEVRFRLPVLVPADGVPDKRVVRPQRLRDPEGLEESGG